MKYRAKFLLATALLISQLGVSNVQPATAATIHDVYVSAFTTANDQNVDGPGIQNAINAAISWKNANPADQVRVIFEAGTYILDQNKRDINVINSQDLTIMGQVGPDGKPSTLIQSNFNNAVGFKVSGGKNLSIMNFSWEMKPNWYTMAKVIYKDASTVKVKVQPNTVVDTTSVMSATEDDPNAIEMMLYDKDRAFASFGYSTGYAHGWEDQSPFWGTTRGAILTASSGKSWQLVSGTTDEMQMNDTKVPTYVEVGDLIFWEQQRPSEGYPFDIGDIDTVLIDNQYAYNFGNFYLHNVNNPTLKRIDLAPKFERGWNGLNLGDVYGTPWFVNASGAIMVDQFKGSSGRDDFMNSTIKGKKVLANPAANQAVISSYSDYYSDFSKLNAGDTIEFYKDTADAFTDLTMTLAQKPVRYTGDLDNDGTNDWLVTFNANFPSGFNPTATLFAFATKYAHSSETYRNTENHGIKHNEWLVHNGTVVDNSVTAQHLQLRSDVEWYEGKFPDNIEIVDSRFYNAGSISASLNATLSSTDRPFSNVRIHDNAFLPINEAMSWNNDRTNVSLNNTNNGQLWNNRFADANDKIVNLSNNNTNTSETGSSIMGKGTTEYATNGNFENGLTGWTVAKGSGIGIENDGGSNRLMIPGGNTYSLVRQELTGLKPDTYYYFSGDARLNNPNNTTNKLFVTLLDSRKVAEPTTHSISSTYSKVSSVFKTGAESSNWRDYTVSADFKRLSGGETALLARMTSATQYYQLVAKAGTVEINANNNGAWTTVATANYTFNNNQWYNLKLELNGSSLKGYVNGALVLQGTDTTFSQGAVALKNYNSTAEFDNVIALPMENTSKLLMAEDFEEGTIGGWNNASGTWTLGDDGSKVYKNTNSTGEAITKFNNTTAIIKVWRRDGTDKAYLDNVSVKELIGVESNLADYRTATSDSNPTGNEAAKAIDGTTATAWKAADSTAGHWLTADLGNEYLITGATAKWNNATSVYKYGIEISNDGTNWRKVVDKSGNTVAESESRLMFDSEKRARYVRITFTSGSALPGINEFAVWGI